MSETGDTDIFRSEDITPLEKRAKRQCKISRITLVVWLALYAVSFVMKPGESISFTMIAILVYSFLLILASGRPYMGFGLATLFMVGQFIYYVNLASILGWFYDIFSLPMLFILLVFVCAILFYMATITSRKLELQKQEEKTAKEVREKITGSF